jgi:hypothetical protein
MEALKTSLGGVKIADLTRERLIEFGKRRAKQGAGPTTLSIDFSFIRTILSHAAAVHGIETSAEDVRLARIALNRLSLIGRGNERDRRPTEDENQRTYRTFREQFTPAHPNGTDHTVRYRNRHASGGDLSDRVDRCRYEEAHNHCPRS